MNAKFRWHCISVWSINEYILNIQEETEQVKIPVYKNKSTRDIRVCLSDIWTAW